MKKVCILGLGTLLPCRKRSRDRVTIGGQCVILQNSHKIKRLDFLKAKITV